MMLLLSSVTTIELCDKMEFDRGFEKNRVISPKDVDMVVPAIVYSNG